jgi:hypothetical protein
MIGGDVRRRGSGSKPIIITGPHPRGGWQNKVEESRRAANVHLTKAAAEAKGREMAMARKTEHVIQDRDGKIQRRNSYGNDPARRPG